MRDRSWIPSLPYWVGLWTLCHETKQLPPLSCSWPFQRNPLVLLSIRKIKIIGESGLPWRRPRWWIISFSCIPIYKHVLRRLRQCRPKPNLIKTFSINAQDTESNTLEMSSLRKTWGSFCLCKHFTVVLECWISFHWFGMTCRGLVNSGDNTYVLTLFIFRLLGDSGR